MNLREYLIEEEGWRTKAYPDPLTKGEPYTIGVGHTGPEVKPGLVWSDAQISAALSIDIHEAREDAKALLPEGYLASLDPVRQAVLVSMAFQMGRERLGKFRATLAAVSRGDWETASEQMRKSLWAAQTPRRAFRAAEMMRTGEWQPWDPRKGKTNG